ncbi:major facilitator superfamily domain-containing protein [Cunninghamella echinulata]|nr:major facilitator superfamily domain-containing protein [Cunninghamella echinulata]
MLSLCAIGGTLSPLSATIYLPALNNIQEDFQITVERVNLTVTAYLILQGLSPSFWGAISDVWGRRPVYIMTITIYCGACIGLALCHHYGVLLFLRMLQAFGSSPLIAVGYATLGDVTEPHNRAGYFGFFSLGQLLGPIIGPIIGGILAGTVGWRWIFWLLVIVSSIILISITLFVNETLRSAVGNGSLYANPTPIQWVQRRKMRRKYQDDHDDEKDNKTNKPIVEKKKKSRYSQRPEFLASFIYLSELDVLVALLYVGFFYMGYYYYLVSTTNLFASLYGLSTLQIGLCYIPQGVASILGSLFSGKLLDYNFKMVSNEYQQNHPSDMIVERGKVPLDFPIYYARLRYTWVFIVLAQLITIIYGWLLQIGAPLAVPIIIQFIVSFCMVALQSGVQTLIVDLFPGKGASISASNNLVRCLLGAIATVTVDAGISSVGVGMFFVVNYTTKKERKKEGIINLISCF